MQRGRFPFAISQNVLVIGAGNDSFIRCQIQSSVAVRFIWVMTQDTSDCAWIPKTIFHKEMLDVIRKRALTWISIYIGEWKCIRFRAASGYPRADQISSRDLTFIESCRAQ